MSASGDGDARALGTWPGPFASVPGAHLPHQRRPLSRLRSWQPRLRPAFSFPGTSVAQSPGPSGAAARAPRLCSHLPPPCPAGGPPGVATCVESARPSASWVRLRDWSERSWLSRPWLPAWGSPGWRNPRPARASFASVRPGLSAGHSVQGSPNQCLLIERQNDAGILSAAASQPLAPISLQSHSAARGSALRAGLSASSGPPGKVGLPCPAAGKTVGQGRPSAQLLVSPRAPGESGLSQQGGSGQPGQDGQFERAHVMGGGSPGH